jgi:hypothetical protein
MRRREQLRIIKDLENVFCAEFWLLSSYLNSYMFFLIKYDQSLISRSNLTILHS